LFEFNCFSGRSRHAKCSELQRLDFCYFGINVARVLITI